MSGSFFRFVALIMTTLSYFEVDNIFAGGGNMLFKLRYAQLLKEMELTELAEKVL